MDNQQTAPGFDEEMREIFESYIVEAKEILDHLSQDLLALEKNPSDEKMLNNIFREMHTLKGTSSFLGFSQIAELAHTSEDLLNKLRKGECVATIEVIDVLIEAHKTAGILLQRIESRNLQPIELGSIIEKLKKGMQQQSDSVQVPVVTPSVKESIAHEDEISEVHPQQTVDTTIRVDVGRLDDLMNLIGELVLARNRLAQAAQSLTEKYERLEMSKQIADVSGQIDFVSNSGYENTEGAD
jgi:two-component system chemotaxis sensor kinase CheA